MNEHDVPLRISEACRRSALSDWQIRQAIRQQKLLAVQIGKTWLIDQRSLERLLRGERAEPDRDAAT